jgi:curved DNA-binding protein CbpA
MRTESFEDFYALLGGSQSASPDEIRKAFRARMREWHPDVNHSDDATSMTQRLIVAYKILNDAEARSHYDVEYAKRIRRAAEPTSSKRPEPKPRPSAPEPTRDRPEAGRATPERPPRDTTYEDPDLDRWVHTARREAAEEWRKFAADFKDASKAAGAGAVHGLWMALIWGTIAFIIFSIIAGMN